MAEAEPTNQDAPRPPGDGRYVVGEALGDGQHRGRDRLLDRPVHLRLADAATAGDLAREASFTARLAHPAVPPVLDLVRDEHGAMLVLGEIEGLTLAEAMAQARAGSPPEAIASPTAAVLTIRQIAAALVAAHARGIVHRAVAPERIVLGAHGTALLTGWRAAMADDVRPATRTFRAGAKAPAATALDDLHDDLRALGRCLFAALLWRAPAEGPDPFAGCTASERARLPPPLAAIVARALGSDSGQGFRSLAGFGEELDRWLAGVPLEAYEPGLWLRLSAWLHRHRRAALTALLLAALGAGGWYAWERWQDRWGPPIAEERFDDAGWRDRWLEAGKGAYIVDKGRLVSQSPRQAVVTFRQRLVAPVAIEYTGQILPGSKPCDLSVWWNEREGGPELASRSSPIARMYMVQAGAVDNSFFAIFEQPSYRRIAHANRQLQVGRDYRFRVEIEGDRITMAVDGEKVMEYRALFPATTGYFSLYGYYPGKSFDDVRIYQKRGRVDTPALAAGDALFQYRHFDEAAAVYARSAETWGDAAVGQLALFRQGLAERAAGRLEASRETWQRLRSPRLAHHADALRLEDLLEQWQIDTLTARFASYYRERSDVRAELRLVWQQLMPRIVADPRSDEATVLRLIRLRDECFPDDSATAYEAAYALLRLDRYEEVLTAFPEERTVCGLARMSLGRQPGPGDPAPYQASSLYARGDLDALLKLPELESGLRAMVMCKRGWPREAQRDTGEVHPAMLQLGQAEQLLASLGSMPYGTERIANDCLIALGRFEEAAGAGLPGLTSGNNPRAMLLLGRIDEAERRMRAQGFWDDPLPVAWARLLVAAEAGDAAAVARLLPQVKPPRNLMRQGGWFAAMVIAPFVAHQGGDQTAMRSALERAIADYAQVFGKRPWHLARFVLGQEEEEALLAMPFAAEAPAWLLVGKGLRAELAGDRAAARAAWQAFAELPRHQRLLDGSTLDVQVELFAAWRLRALSRG